jgi:hypothetical protein
MYVEAIRRLKRTGFVPKRTVYVTYVPGKILNELKQICRQDYYFDIFCFKLKDEEIGGSKGMSVFLQSQEFQEMNVSLALDEGAATLGDEYAIFYGERSVFRRFS